MIPSQWEEAFGRVAVEGMANGIPVIASNIAGLKDAVVGGGVLVEDYGDVDIWAREIIKFDDPLYYKKIAKTGKIWVEKNYSLKNIISDAFDFFNEIIHPPKRGS